MTKEILSLVVGTVLTTFHFVLMISLLRKIIPNKFPPMSIHVFSAITTLAILLIFWLIYTKFYFWLAFSIIIFGISVCFFAFGAIYKSLSIRFLLMTKNHGLRASLDKLDILVTDASFSERIKILCDMNLVTKENDGYKISKKGLIFTKRINLLRRFFAINTTGLY